LRGSCRPLVKKRFASTPPSGMSGSYGGENKKVK
jgi:hypothetical protein